MKADDHIERFVPDQHQGSSMDAIEKRVAQSREDAARLFERASGRLLNINGWGNLAGVSAFQLMDASGIRVEREVREGDYIRIDIPGPGTIAGMGYDWVRVEEIQSFGESDGQIVGIRVRPSAHPVSGSLETAHFLKDTATSTFIIKRIGIEVLAEEHGRNEVTNTDAERLLDKGRNFTVGIAAKLGLSYPQWKSLVKAFLAD